MYRGRREKYTYNILTTVHVLHRRMSRCIRCLVVWAATVVFVNTVPTYLSLCLLSGLAFLCMQCQQQNRTFHDDCSNDSVSTVLCLRGFTYGLSRSTCDRLYHEVSLFLDEHPRIHIIAWDGDLNMKGSFATVIQQLMDHRPELQFLAFKKTTSMHKLCETFIEMNTYGVQMTGFVTGEDHGPMCCYSYDELTAPWTPSSRFSVIGFPPSRLTADNSADYVELTYAGLTFLRHTMEHTHVTILTMGEGPVVQAEKDRIHHDKRQADTKGNAFPLVERWVRLEVQREPMNDATA